MFPLWFKTRSLGCSACACMSALSSEVRWWTWWMTVPASQTVSTWTTSSPATCSKATGSSMSTQTFRAGCTWWGLEITRGSASGAAGPQGSAPSDVSWTIDSILKSKQVLDSQYAQILVYMTIDGVTFWGSVVIFGQFIQGLGLNLKSTHNNQTFLIKHRTLITTVIKQLHNAFIAHSIL